MASRSDNPIMVGISKNIGMSQIFSKLKSMPLLNSLPTPSNPSFMYVRMKAAIVGPNGARYNLIPHRTSGSQSSQDQANAIIKNRYKSFSDLFAIFKGDSPPVIF